MFAKKYSLNFTSDTFSCFFLPKIKISITFVLSPHMFIDDHLQIFNFNSNVFYIQVIYKQIIIKATEQNAKN